MWEGERECVCSWVWVRSSDSWPKPVWYSFKWLTWRSRAKTTQSTLPAEIRQRYRINSQTHRHIHSCQGTLLLYCAEDEVTIHHHSTTILARRTTELEDPRSVNLQQKSTSPLSFTPIFSIRCQQDFHQIHSCISVHSWALVLSERKESFNILLTRRGVVSNIILVVFFSSVALTVWWQLLTTPLLIRKKPIWGKLALQALVINQQNVASSISERAVDSVLLRYISEVITCCKKQSKLPSKRRAQHT